MARVEVLCGTARSDRAAEIDGRFLAAAGRGVLVVPTRQVAQARAVALATAHDLPGFAGPSICTFQDFAQGIVAGTAYEGARIGTVEQRLLLERVFDGLRGTQAFSEAGSGVETPGFLNHAQRVIAQLKQAAIPPEQFGSLVARRQGKTAIDDLLVALYAAYQETLLAQNVYDLQGLYWSADLACTDRSTDYFSTRRVALFDGFDDFTVSELRLIEDTAGYVDELTIGLHADMMPDRHDLYARTLDVTRLFFSNDFSETILEFAQPEPADHVAFTGRHLFWRDLPPTSPPAAANVSLVACHTLLHEFETVARRIKRLVLDEGVSLDRIAVVMRDPRTHGALMASVFEEFGVPLRMPFGMPLSEAPEIAFFQRVLDAIDGWKQQAVLDVLESPYFRPEGVAVAHQTMAPVVARLAQVIDGRDEWTERLERLARDLAEHGQYFDDWLRRIPELEAGAASMARAAHTLAACAEAWPSTGSLPVFARAADGLIDRLGLAGEAVAALRAVFRRLAKWTEDDTHSLERAAFLRRLENALSNESLPVTVPREAVVCLDLEASRHLVFDHVYLVHANEGELPSRPPFNAIYTEAELEQWRQEQVLFEVPATHAQREMLLFQRVFETARATLTISWHTLARNGQARQASPFVHDVRELLPGVSVEHLDSRQAIVAPEPNFAMAPRDGASVTVLREGADSKLIASHFPRVAVGAALERIRYGATPFEAHDGMLGEGPALRAIQSTYDAAHTFSANQLETYLDCPFRFLIERVLHLLPTEQPEEAFDRRVYGIILHDALRRFHEAHRGKAVVEIDEARAREDIEACAEEAFQAIAKRSITAPRGVVDVERRRLLLALDKYVTVELERDFEGQWKPSFFEVCFGMTPREGDDGKSTETPFTLETEAGPVHFGGRIDRIDDNSECLRLVDYKTSPSIKVGTITSGKNIQLGLYSLAVEQAVIPQSRCTYAHYLPVGRNKKDYVEALAKSGRSQTKWPERKTILERAVADSVTGIREGRFHPTTEADSCSYCPMGNVCRHERARVERKAEAGE